MYILISYFVFFFLKISKVESDGTLCVKFFGYVSDKGYRMNDLEYTISTDDVVRVIDPPVIKHVSKRRGWVLFRDRDLNVSSESYSDFSI